VKDIHVLNATMRVWNEEDFAYHDIVVVIRGGDPDAFRREHERRPLVIVARAKVY